MKLRDVKHSGLGDININENNISIGKPLVQCTNEELLCEREHRLKRLDIENKKRKSEKKPFVILWFIVLIFGAIYGIYKTNNPGDITTWIYAAPGAILAILSIQGYITPSKYEIKHLQALDEIKDILRERGVE